MNKADLIAALAEKVGGSKSDAKMYLEAFQTTVESELKKGGSVGMVGFGTFKVSKRKARVGRNPKTGAEIKIAARNVPVFSAGKGLKDLVK